MNDIVIARLKDPTNRRTVHNRPSRLLGEQTGKLAKSGAKGMNGQPLGFFEGSGRVALIEQFKSVDVVNDINGVTSPHQGVGEPPDEDRVTAEVVGGIEGRDHGKAQPAHQALLAKTIRAAPVPEAMRLS
jgi:hypothetical protein